MPVQDWPLPGNFFTILWPVQLEIGIYVERLFEFIKRLSFWQFIGLFVLIAVVISEALIVVQSYWLKGAIDRDFLIIGFITPAVDAFVVFFVTALVLERYRRQQKQQEKTEAYLRKTKKIANVFDWELDIGSGRMRWPDELLQILRLDKYAPLGLDYLSTIVDPEDWPELEASLSAAINQGKRHQREYRVHLPDGQIMWVFCQAERVLDDEGRAFLHGVIQDITQNKLYEQSLLDARVRAEQAIEQVSEVNVQLQSEVARRIEIEKRLSHMAMYDPLTDLPNRIMFVTQARQVLAHASRNRQQVGVMFADLDGFRHINDRFGHDIGDAVLVQFALNTKEAVRACDLVARLGGDEFIMLLPETHGSEALEGIAERIIDFRGNHMDFLDGTPPSVSIGISIFPQDSESIETLVKLADRAMEQAKHNGKNCWQFYRMEEWQQR